MWQRWTWKKMCAMKENVKDQESSSNSNVFKNFLIDFDYRDTILCLSFYCSRFTFNNDCKCINCIRIRLCLIASIGFKTPRHNEFRYQYYLCFQITVYKKTSASLGFKSYYPQCCYLNYCHSFKVFWNCLATFNNYEDSS